MNVEINPDDSLTCCSVGACSTISLLFEESWGYWEIMSLLLCPVICLFVSLYLRSWLNLLHLTINWINKIIWGPINYHVFQNHFQSRIVLEYPILPPLVCWRYAVPASKLSPCEWCCQSLTVTMHGVVHSWFRGLWVKVEIFLYDSISKLVLILSMSVFIQHPFLQW